MKKNTKLAHNRCYDLYSSDIVRTAGIFFLKENPTAMQCRYVCILFQWFQMQFSMYEQGRCCGVPAREQNPPAIILIWAAKILHRWWMSSCLLLRAPGLAALGSSSRGIKYSQTIPNIKCIMKNTWEARGKSMIKNLGWFPFFAFHAGNTSWGFRPWMCICTK